MNKFFFLLLSLIMVTPSIYASGGDQLIGYQDNAIVPNILFKRFYSSNGLPDERIRSIFQDHNGYLWIGTMNGICRYDGYSFKNFFKTKNDNSISGNWAYTITEDAEHNIWIGTNEGFSKFDQQKEVFINYSLPQKGLSQQAKRVNTLVFDKQGMLWIGSKTGLTKYNPHENRFTVFYQHPFNVNVSKIIQSTNNYLWVATESGLIHYSIDKATYSFFNLAIKPNPYGDRIWSLMEDNANLFIGTASDGLLKLPFIKENVYGTIQYLNHYNASKHSLENTQVFDISKSTNGDLWLGTEKGLAQIKAQGTTKASIEFYTNNSINNKTISSDRIYCTYIDKTNVLWCGTEVGLNNLPLSALPFNYYCFGAKGFTDQVRSIYVDSLNNANVWLASYKSGYFKFNTTNYSTYSYSFIPENSFFNGTRSLMVAGNKVMLGTLDGLVITDSKTASSYQTILKGHAVFVQYKDRTGNYWIGTNSGLFEITTKGEIIDINEKSNINKHLFSSFVRSIFQDHHNNIWVGFENGGVVVIDNKTGIATKEINNNKGEGVFGSTIYSITEYPENTLWFGSESGLTKLNVKDNTTDFATASFKNYTIKNGLPDKSVNGILSDENGHLWISSIKGLVKFDIATEVFQNYLPNIYFNHSSCYKLNKHSLYFGTSDGFIQFDPAAIVEDKMIPDVAISDIKLFNQSIKIDQAFNGDVILDKSLSNTNKISLNYQNNVFTIEFAALHFANPEQNKFLYKMQGFDKDWIQAISTNRSATYTNLDPGTYTFKLKAANYLGIWNNNPTTLSITILPPPWKTWWAISIYLILALAFLYYFTIYVLDQIKQKEQLRYEQMEKNQLKKLDSMKTQFFTDISHEFRTPLSLIVGPAEELISSSSLSNDSIHQVQLIHRNSKKLLYLIDELMTFQKLDEDKLQLKQQEVEMLHFVKDVFHNFLHLAERKQISFKINADAEAYPVNIDTGKMEMVLNNLLFNAFKYVPEKGIININVEKCGLKDLPSVPNKLQTEWVKVTVQDNGKGISEADSSHLFERYFQSDNALKGTGVGLSLTKRLVELHKGMITASSAPGINTSFSFFLPLRDIVITQGIESEQHYQLGYDISDLVEDTVLNKEEHLQKIKSKNTLLLVDDNVEVLDYLELVFQSEYNIIRAEDGAKAWDYLQNHEPDLIISDVMMPEMDGVTLCKEVKNNLLTSHIPLILLTAKATVENTLQGLKIGADDYVPKPFYPEVLKVKVRNFIEARNKLIDKFTHTEGGVVIPKNITHNPLDEDFLNNVIAAINKNIDNEEFSVEELGTIVAMSRSNLFRKLKAITGQTPIEFIYFMRMNKAMQLLLQRRFSVSQISYEVGFKSPSSFTKSFKKQFGKSPTDYLNDAIATNKEEEL